MTRLFPAIPAFLFAMASLWSPLALAQNAGSGCSATQLASVARNAGIPLGKSSGGDSEGPVLAHACKQWPYDPSITLATVAFALSPEETPPGERIFTLSVSMLDTESHRILAATQQQLEEDAALEISSSALKLDSARYDLAPGVRAFGVVMSSSARGASCPDGGAENELTLYVREGSNLRPVMETYLDEWVMVAGENCGGNGSTVTDSASTMIAVGPATSNGFADLVLTAKVTRQHYSDETQETRDDPARAVRETLRYNGARYNENAYDHLRFWEAEKRQ